MASGTTHGKRRLGAFLKPIRQRSGLTDEQIATTARCSRQTVARLMAGDNLPRFYLFTTLLGIIGATDDERAKAVALWEVADAPTAMIEHAEDLPAKYRRFRLDEAEAVRERTFDTWVVPGLLQTPDYVRALARRRRATRGPDLESQVVADRRERQALLTRPNAPLYLHALIDEGVLRRNIGGKEVMAGQLRHLLAAQELINVELLVLPFDSDGHGAIAGPMFLLSYPEPDEPDEAYVESVVGIENVGDTQNVAELSAVWDEIAAAAPSPARSVEMIQELLAELER